MNTHKKRIAYAVSILLTLFSIFSCSKMNDLHQPYLDRGETIYAAKADSVAFRSGKNRALLEIFVKSQRVDMIRIYWNSYKDSIDLQLGNKTGVFNQMINNLEENSYTMNLVSFDKYKNRSLPFEVVGMVYGDNYQRTLLSSAISEMLYTYYDTLQVNLSEINEYMLGFEMKYTLLGSSTETTLNIDQVKNLKWISNSAFKLPVTLDPAQNVKWRTAYLPQKNAIDTFYTQWREYPPPALLPQPTDMQIR